MLVPVTSVGLTPEQMVVPLSVKATVPVRVVLPDGTGMLAVKVTVWFTVEGLADELSVMLEVAAVTVWATVFTLVWKLFALSV